MEEFKNPNGTYDGAGVLGKISGLGKEKVNEIWEKVKANHRLLDACSKHDFSIDVTEGQTLNKRWKCVHCGGIVDTIAKGWYEKGVQHGSTMP